METAWGSEPTVVVGGRFRLEAELGRGGLAVVWRATDLVTNHPVAVKLIHPEYATFDEVRTRFEREARLLTELQHPNIAHAVALGVESEQPYLVMELVEGQSLFDFFVEHARKRAALDPADIATLMRQLIAAVGYAHSRRVVHRDLKPGNVMVTRHDGRLGVKVLDFGLAKLLESEAFALTTQGRIMGSVLYMAPEQALGQPMDERLDVFSLGVISFEMLTLRRPWYRDARGLPEWLSEKVRFNGENTIEKLIERLVGGPRPRPSDYGFGIASLDPVVDKALAPSPADRFQSVAELGDALERALGRVRFPTHVAARMRAEAAPPMERMDSGITDPTITLEGEAARQMRPEQTPQLPEEATLADTNFDGALDSFLHMPTRTAYGPAGGGSEVQAAHTLAVQGARDPAADPWSASTLEPGALTSKDDDAAAKSARDGERHRRRFQLAVLAVLSLLAMALGRWLATLS